MRTSRIDWDNRLNGIHGISPRWVILWIKRKQYAKFINAMNGKEFKAERQYTSNHVILMAYLNRREIEELHHKTNSIHAVEAAAYAHVNGG